MKTQLLPPRDEMQAAFLGRDPEFDGVFFTAVKTTGIFCKPTCSAKKPKPENVDFYATTREALLAGFRPCKRCKPMRPSGAPPEWIEGLLDEVEKDPSKRWKDQDLRNLDLQPDRVRRWFQQAHGMTFHAYNRARRLGLALGQIQLKSGSVTAAAYDSGYESISGFNDAFKHLFGTAPTTASDSGIVSITRIPTPMGPMVACATDDAICLLEFADRRGIETQLRTLRKRLDCYLVPGVNGVLKMLADQLQEYFDGQRLMFDIPVVAPGTDFQEQVWSQLRTIKPGETISYADLAGAIGRPTAVRAVARANGDNRLAILVPCHRVVGSDGKLTGYAGGLWRKQRLLDLEKRD